MSTPDGDIEISPLIEPYRVKVVERIRRPSREERARAMKEAFYSVVYLRSSDVFIDMVTDSGTSAMSADQWAGMMIGDEAYMGSRNFFHFEETVREITGYRHIIPTHQGRAAENILMELLVKPGDIIPSNTLFDTTRAHVHNRSAQPLDLVGDCLWDFDGEHPFKGNVDIERLEAAMEKHHDEVPFIVITVVNNMAASSPVSMENVRAVRRIADRYGKPVLFDAARFAENAYFIKQREPGYGGRSIDEIAREMFSYGHGAWMSAKKDGLVNIGGFIALTDEALARKCQERLVLYEGFPTYGGLARRDLEAMAVGLREGMAEEHLRHRIGQVEYLGKLLEKEAGVVVSKPTGGSGVFVDVDSIYPHLPAERLPCVALTCDLYLHGGVRVGAAPFGLTSFDPKSGTTFERVFQVARFAVPRRVYTQSHLDYTAKVTQRIKTLAPSNRGYRLIHEPGVLGHFFTKFEPYDAGP